MTDLTVVQEFPTPTITLLGFSDKGAYISIGELPLVDPSARQEIIDATFDYVLQCQKEETMCRIGDFLFYPTAFDFFTVQ